MMARDDRVIKTNDVESLLSRTIEVRKMLHGLQNAVLAFPRMRKKPVPTS
jgi:hypothetical protein